MHAKLRSWRFLSTVWLIVGLLTISTRGAYTTAAEATHKYTSSGDRFIAASAIQSLDGQWNASLPSRALTVAATVPGDLISDLQRAGVVADPLRDINWLDNRSVALWNATGWHYSREFVVEDQQTSSGAFLVFDSIKMGATVAVNGRVVGTAKSQFMRYVFPVDLKAGANTVSVHFNDTDNHSGRYMACTGGWDWAFYTNTFISTFDSQTEPTFSRGIVKSAYIAFVEV